MTRRVVHALVVVLLARVASRAETVLHVSPSGSPDGDGTVDRPFASLPPVLDDVARRIASGLSGDVRVVLHDGVFRITEPLRLGPAHTPADGKLIFEAADGARPVISGGRPLTGWTRRDDGVLVAKLPSAAGDWRFRELFIGGERRPRARHPNEGFLRIVASFPDKRTGFTWSAGDIPAAVTGGCELVFLHDWSITRVAVASIDHESARLTVAHEIGNQAKHYEIDHFEQHPRYYLEDHPLFLDAPGEWYLDAGAGEVLYRPRDGESVETLSAVAPFATALVVARGTEERPLRDVHFRGITFEHAAWSIPVEGYASGQATVHERRDGTAQSRGRAMVEAAIRLELAENCSLVECRVARIGLSGVSFGSRTRRCRLESCVIEDISGNGVNLGEDTSRGVDGGAWWRTAPEQIATGNVVKANLIERCGRQFFGAVAVWVGLGRGMHIVHNEIRDHPYTGVSLGWMWSSTPTPAGENVVEHNHIHHVMQVLSDGGGIYTLGRQPGTSLSHNAIHDVPLNLGRAESNGMFIDEGSDQILIRGNAIWGIDRSPLRFHRAQQIRVEENVLVVAQKDVPPLRYNNTDPATVAQQGNVVVEQAEFALESVRAIIEAAGRGAESPGP